VAYTHLAGKGNGGGCWAELKQPQIPLAIVSLSCDINGDNIVTLADAILALQVSARISPARGVQVSGDVNGDGRIGLEEAIYSLQYIAGLR